MCSRDGITLPFCAGSWQGGDEGARVPYQTNSRGDGAEEDLHLSTASRVETHPGPAGHHLSHRGQGVPPADSSDEETLLEALEKLGERMSEEGESSSLAGMEGELLLQEEEGVRWLC